jgi:hypothetical protein
VVSVDLTSGEFGEIGFWADLVDVALVCFSADLVDLALDGFGLLLVSMIWWICLGGRLVDFVNLTLGNL